MKEFAHIICFLLFLLCTSSLYSQNKVLPPGVTLKTTGPGEPTLIPVPKQDSPRYKLRYKMPDSLAFTCLLKEYSKSEYISGDDERVIGGQSSKDDIFIVEMIPDLITSFSMRMFFNFPNGFQVFKYIRTSKEGTCLKYIQFESVDEELCLDLVPVFLVYEDDTASSKNEQIVRKYIKDDKLPVNKTANKKLFSELPKYWLVHYEIEYQK